MNILKHLHWYICMGFPRNNSKRVSQCAVDSKVHSKGTSCAHEYMPKESETTKAKIYTV